MAPPMNPDLFKFSEPTCASAIFFGLLIGAFVKEIHKKTGFSYTVMLLYVGIAAGYF